MDSMAVQCEATDLRRDTSDVICMGVRLGRSSTTGFWDHLPLSRVSPPNSRVGRVLTPRRVPRLCIVAGMRFERMQMRYSCISVRVMPPI